MLWLSIVGFGLIAILVVRIIGFFCAFRRAPLSLLLALFAAVYIAFSIILLVPIDLATTTSDYQPLLYLPRQATFALWRIVYWLSFALTWAILPMTQAFLESGHKDRSKRMQEAIRSNARYQLVQLTLAAVGLVYFTLYAGFSITSLKAMAIALSHSYSLILSIIFLGIGVVGIPRALYNRSSSDKRLRALEELAPSLKDHQTEARMQYSDVSAEVRALTSVMDGPFELWIAELINDAQDVVPAPPLNRMQVTEEYLSTLTFRLRKCRLQYERYEYEWNQLILQAADLLDIIASRQTHELRFRMRNSKLSPKLAYFYYVWIKPLLFKIYALLTAAFSALVVMSEILESTEFSILGFLSTLLDGFQQELLSFAIVGYMCIAAYSSLAKVRIFNIFNLAPRHTDTRSAIFYATQICRMTIPLAYSYISMVPPHVQSSVFEEFLQPSINLTPLGKYFVQWLPRFILIPVLVSYFNLYHWLQQKLGFLDSFGEDEEAVGSRAEGRDLISYELNARRIRAESRQTTL
ncbi:LMBR1-like membrane protein [Myxozyma melibiosi]|uniref:LMBR1-like membrane protein n=1 Tax=Myxozyma melibiosi TaxID=54550 RepID=A0ABR1FCR5_9ASCO